MDTIWFGVKIGLGIAAGMALWAGGKRIPEEVRAFRRGWAFMRAGFDYESNRNVKGWLSRDPNNDDWILWDDRHGVMLRSSDYEVAWRISTENMQQCLSLGREYKRVIMKL